MRLPVHMIAAHQVAAHQVAAHQVATHHSTARQVATKALAPKSALATMPEPSLGGSALKMVLILGVLAAIAWYMRRRSNGAQRGTASIGKASRLSRFAGSAPRSNLRVVSRQTLGKGACLAVVEWEGREVLVGITNAGISFYDDSSTVASEMATADLLNSENETREFTVPFQTTSTTSRASAAAHRLSPMAILRGRPDETTTAINSVEMTSSSITERDGTERPNFLDALRDLTVRH